VGKDTVVQLFVIPIGITKHEFGFPQQTGVDSNKRILEYGF